MLFFRKNKKRNLRVHSKHVYSFDFRQIQSYSEQKISDEDFQTITTLPILRINNDRALAVNEYMDTCKGFINILTSLDKMRDTLLLDVLKLYKDQFGEIDADHLSGANENETYKKVVYFLIPEVLWAHGHEISSKLF